MTARFDYERDAPGIYVAMAAADGYLDRGSIPRTLLYLLQLYASRINGCTYCIAMHTADLRALGETDERLDALEAWRGSTAFTPRERAALAWTDAVTRVTDGHVPDRIHAQESAHFSQRELADLTFAIAVINAWNRLSVAARLGSAGGLNP